MVPALRGQELCERETGHPSSGPWQREPRMGSQRRLPGGGVPRASWETEWLLSTRRTLGPPGGAQREMWAEKKPSNTTKGPLSLPEVFWHGRLGGCFGIRAGTAGRPVSGHAEQLQGSQAQASVLTSGLGHSAKRQLCLLAPPHLSPLPHRWGLAMPPPPPVRREAAGDPGPEHCPCRSQPP